MKATAERWKEITRSEYPWEQEALAFVRERLPDHEPYRAGDLAATSWPARSQAVSDGRLKLGRYMPGPPFIHSHDRMRT